METVMNTTTAAKALRDHVVAFMASLPIPAATPAGDGPQRREDGVLEFHKHWRLRGDARDGLFATYSDSDDIIEFGITERSDGVAINVLLASVVLDDDGARLNVMSETDADRNYDVQLSPRDLDRLGVALRAFAANLRGE